MQTFNITALAGNRALVSGTDENDVDRKVIVDSEEWTLLKQQDQVDSATQAFDDAVEAFFAPITAAVDALEDSTKLARDDAFYVVIQEAEQGNSPKREVLHTLKRDTVILRMIDSGNTSRLIWIDDSIEILAPAVVAPQSTVSDVIDDVPSA